MFFRRRQSAPTSGVDHLDALMRQTLDGADDDTVAIATACAGLLACVGFADRDYSDEERTRVRELLTRIHGVDEHAAGAIDELLAAHVRELCTVQPPRFTRVLRESGDRELRLEVLGMLIEVAAADDVITHDEVALLRQLTTALGLDQADYNRLQAAHRDKLASLR